MMKKENEATYFIYENFKFFGVGKLSHLFRAMLSWNNSKKRNVKYKLSEHHGTKYSYDAIIVLDNFNQVSISIYGNDKEVKISLHLETAITELSNYISSRIKDPNFSNDCGFINFLNFHTREINSTDKSNIYKFIQKFINIDKKYHYNVSDPLAYCQFLLGNDLIIIRIYSYISNIPYFSITPIHRDMYYNPAPMALTGPYYNYGINTIGYRGNPLLLHPVDEIRLNKYYAEQEQNATKNDFRIICSFPDLIELLGLKDSGTENNKEEEEIEKKMEKDKKEEKIIAKSLEERYLRQAKLLSILFHADNVDIEPFKNKSIQYINSISSLEFEVNSKDTRYKIHINEKRGTKNLYDVKIFEKDIKDFIYKIDGKYTLSKEDIEFVVDIFFAEDHKDIFSLLTMLEFLFNPLIHNNNKRRRMIYFKLKNVLLSDKTDTIDLFHQVKMNKENLDNVTIIRFYTETIYRNNILNEIKISKKNMETCLNLFYYMNFYKKKEEPKEKEKITLTDYERYTVQADILKLFLEVEEESLRKLKEFIDKTQAEIGFSFEYKAIITKSGEGYDFTFDKEEDNIINIRFEEKIKRKNIEGRLYMEDLDQVFQICFHDTTKYETIYVILSLFLEIVNQWKKDTIYAKEKASDKLSDLQDFLLSSESNEKDFKLTNNIFIRCTNDNSAIYKIFQIFVKFTGIKETTVFTRYIKEDELKLILHWVARIKNI